MREPKYKEINILIKKIDEVKLKWYSLTTIDQYWKSITKNVKHTIKSIAPHLWVSEQYLWRIYTGKEYISKTQINKFLDELNKL